MKKQIEYKKQQNQIEELKIKIGKNQKIKEAIKPTEDKVKNQKEIIVKLEKDLDNLNVNIVKGEEKEKEHEKKIQSVNKIGELYREYSECKNVKQELLEKGNRIKKIEELENKKMAQLEKYTKLENEYKVMNNDYLEKEDEFFKSASLTSLPKFSLNSCIKVFICELVLIHSSCCFCFSFCLSSNFFFNWSNTCFVSTLKLFWAILGCSTLPHTGQGLLSSNFSAIIPACSLKNSSRYSVFGSPCTVSVLHKSLGLS